MPIKNPIKEEARLLAKAAAMLQTLPETQRLNRECREKELDIREIARKYYQKKA